MEIYPNPFDNDFHIKPNDGIIFIGSDGKIYFGKPSISSRLIKIGSKEYPSGLYYVMVKTEKEQYTRKIIKPI